MWLFHPSSCLFVPHQSWSSNSWSRLSSSMVLKNGLDILVVHMICSPLDTGYYEQRSQYYCQGPPLADLQEPGSYTLSWHIVNSMVRPSSSMGIGKRPKTLQGRNMEGAILCTKEMVKSRIVVDDGRDVNPECWSTFCIIPSNNFRER